MTTSVLTDAPPNTGVLNKAVNVINTTSRVITAGQAAYTMFQVGARLLSLIL